MDRNDDAAPASEDKADTTAAAPAPDTTPAAKVSTSIFDDEGDDDAAPAAPAAKSEVTPAEGDKTSGDKPAELAKDAKSAAWREDWREALAGGDDKRLAELKRYASMDAWAKSQFGLKQKLSSGEYVRKPAVNASEEEKAKWREDMGIPKSSEGYELPNTVKLTDADKPLVQDFLKALHDADAPQPIAAKAIEWYGNFVAKQEEKMYQTDVADKQSVEDALRTEWTNEYRPNLNLIGRYLKDQETLPEGFAEKLNGARTPDGHRLINDPQVANWLLTLAKDRYGEGAMLYGDAKVATTGRKEELEKILNTDASRYFREGLDKEYGDILTKLEKANVKTR